MKKALGTIVSIALGAVLGWLIINPPDWPAPSGAAGFLIAGAILIALLVVSIVFTIGLSLPKVIRVGPYTGAVDPSINDQARQIKDLGFVEAGEPMLIGIRPAATLMALIHPREPVYATVFRTGTMPAVTSYDFVSIFDGSYGGLTTSTNWRGGILPAGPGAFRQIITGASPKEAFDAHLAGARWLGDRGLRMKNISADDFVPDFKEALSRQRETFRSSPLKNAFIALLRTLSKRVPERGPLASQKSAEFRARKLLSARNA